jgi:hypothetical protein
LLRSFGFSKQLTQRHQECGDRSFVGDLDAANLKARAHRKANADVSAKRIAELEAENRKLDVTLPA